MTSGMHPRAIKKGLNSSSDRVAPAAVSDTTSGLKSREANEGRPSRYCRRLCASFRFTLRSSARPRKGGSSPTSITTWPILVCPCPWPRSPGEWGCTICRARQHVADARRNGHTQKEPVSWNPNRTRQPWSGPFPSPGPHSHVARSDRSAGAEPDVPRGTSGSAGSLGRRGELRRRSRHPYRPDRGPGEAPAVGRTAQESRYWSASYREGSD